MVFHAGTVPAPEGEKGDKSDKGEALTAGGRVVCVTALGNTVKEAQQHAYDVASRIHFDGAQYRKDIGYRAIKS
jgi:phosphoribosylamine--glycine ligase